MSASSDHACEPTYFIVCSAKEEKASFHVLQQQGAHRVGFLQKISHCNATGRIFGYSIARWRVAAAHSHDGLVTLAV